MQLDEQTAKFYDGRWQRQYNMHGAGLPKYNLRYNSLHKVLATYLNPEDVVLEVACGQGYFANKYLRRICKDFMSTDFSKTAIDMAKEAYPSIADKFHILGAFMKTKFAYNTIVALEFLEHTDRDVKFLTQVKPGTKVIFSVPINERQKSGMPGYPRGYPSHRRIYTQQSMESRYGPIIDIEAIRLVTHGRAHWAAVKGYRK